MAVGVGFGGSEGVGGEFYFPAIVVGAGCARFEKMEFDTVRV